MKLDLMCEDKDVLLVEEALQNNIITEDFADILDTSAEVVFGAIGFIPGAGEILGDAPMLIKNLIQGDYLGAAIFLVSMEPTPISDTIAKTLRAIQKLAKHTGQEQKLNKFIGWLLEKTGSNPKTKIMSMFEKMSNIIGDVEEKTGKTRHSGDEKVKKHGMILSKVTKQIKKHLPRMEKELEQFLDLIEKKAQKLEPEAGIDMPDEYFEDLTNKVEEQYRKFLKNDAKKAIEYKNKVKANAMKNDNYSKKLKGGFEKIFGPIEDKVK